MQHTPMISVLVCTHGRTSPICACVKRILDTKRGLRELLIVDQNQNDSVETLLQEFRADPRLRYYRVSVQNKGLALNYGIALAQEDIVVVTDDDCLVALDWLDDYQTTFRDNPQAAVAFGHVFAAAHEIKQGYIPDSKISEDRKYSTLRSLADTKGIGANMAVRRSFVLSFGGFDALLSPGGRFHASEDRDISIRSILNGYEVHECRGSVVEHSGFRDWIQGRAHTYRDWLGIGAMCAKLIKYQTREAWPFVSQIVLKKLLRPYIHSLTRRDGPKGAIKISGFLRGMILGWGAPVDPQTMLFRGPDTSTEKDLLVASWGEP